MKTTTLCPTCGTSFTRVHVASQPPVYCSSACRNRSASHRRATAEGHDRRRRALGIVLQPGEFISGGRVYVMIDPDLQAALGLRKPHTLRSRLVWREAHPDDPILPGEVIHHINENKMDDRPENLAKLRNQREHARLHDELGDLNTRRINGRQADRPCEVCGAPIRPWRRFCSVGCSARGNRAFAGKTHSDTSLAKQRAAKLGKAMTPETRERMRLARLAYLERISGI